MDILLIIITVIIVMGIAYILSRPFAHPEPVIHPPHKTQDTHMAYLNLLRDIKILQAKVESLDAPGELLSQIEDKKQRAASLLRLINEPMEVQEQPAPASETQNLEDTQPENPFLRDNTSICPRCGGNVTSSDKFCTHCGNRLQP
jgi:hypothetical protein